MDVPLHEPERYCPGGQLLLAHVLHPKALVVPEQEPVRYFPAAQLASLQTVHV